MPQPLLQLGVLSRSVASTVLVATAWSLLCLAAFSLPGFQGLLLAQDGYTPPNNGGPDSSQGSGTRCTEPLSLGAIL